MGAAQTKQLAVADRVERFLKAYPEINQKDRALIRQEVGHMVKYYSIGWVSMDKVPMEDRYDTGVVKEHIYRHSDLTNSLRIEFARFIDAIAHNVCGSGGSGGAKKKANEKD